MPRKPLFWSALSACLVVLAAVLTFPDAFGFFRSGEVDSITKADGFRLSAQLPRGLARPDKRALLFPDDPVVLEDGKPLARPLSGTKEITNAGRGRYRFRGSELQFSTSDGGPPDGRAYEVRASRWSVSEPWLLAVWAAAFFSCAVAVEIRGCAGGRFRATVLTPLGLAAALAACLWLAGPEAFFTGLLLPLLWALVMGWCALQQRLAGRISLFLAAILPAFAGYFYYAVRGASDSSLLVGGVIPWSDAKVYFLQAAGIAIHGSTNMMFNGRFLYPAFESAALALTGLNLSLANLLVSVLVMVALAFTCRPVAARTGFAGTSLYCLLTWLYFRAHGCGLVMTENLGLLMGLLAFAFLLLSVDRGAIRPLFVSIALFALSSAARPGALFILPALVLYAGIRVWLASEGRMRLAQASGACVMALALAAACFASNQILLKTFYTGEGRSFGNFAFTLHGLLNGTNWSTSYEATNGDARRVMKQNIQQLKESPDSLLRGIRRAYAETLKDGFFFCFNREKRLAHAGMILFALGALACGFWRPLRRDAWWIVPLFAGILASVPFAPPWDAEVRPYAASVPVQSFLAAAGLAVVIALLRNAARRLVERISATEPGGSPEETQSDPRAGEVRWLAGFAVLCLAMLFPLPLLLKFSGGRIPPAGPFFHAGSQLIVTNETHAAFLDGLSEFQAHSPDAARVFCSARPDFVLAVDWGTLRAVLLRHPLPEVLPPLTDAGGVMADPAVWQGARKP